jgi:hypothetical protein
MANCMSSKLNICGWTDEEVDQMDTHRIPKDERHEDMKQHLNPTA